MIIIETSIFTRRIQALLSDEEYRLLQRIWCFARTRVNLFPEVDACVKAVGRPKDTGNVAGCA